MATREQVAELEAAAKWADAMELVYVVAEFGSDEEADAGRRMNNAHRRLDRARAACIDEPSESGDG